MPSSASKREYVYQRVGIVHSFNILTCLLLAEAPAHFQVEGVGTSVVHPVGVAALIGCGLSFVVLPRRYALLPLIGLICFVSSRQCVAIFGLNLYFVRIIVLFFLPLRLLLRREPLGIRWNWIDGLVAFAGVWFIIAGAINSGFDPSILKTRCGYAVEAIGIYFICRYCIVGRDSLESISLGFSIAAVVVCLFFILENRTGYNLFSVFGGVPAKTMIREGRLRCQGAFGHPILAGVFWAAVLPFLLYFSGPRSRHKLVMRLGVCAAALVVLLTASSTPVVAMLFIAVAWCWFPFRGHTRTALTAMAGVLIALHFAMQSPVWSLIARVTVTSGNSGYHRFLLVDGFINHADEWFFVGSNMGTDHWGYYTHDTANQFVSAGVSGGILYFLTYVALTCLAMRSAARLARPGMNPYLGWSVWVSAGVLLVSFLGISIWGQLHFAFGFVMAAAASIASDSRAFVKRPMGVKRAFLRSPHPQPLVRAHESVRSPNSFEPDPVPCDFA